MTKRKDIDTGTKKQMFLWVLGSCMNNVSKACEVIGIDRTTYYKWVENDEQFADEARAVKENFIDWVEEKQTALINSLDGPQIRYFLDRQARHRGYGQVSKQVKTFPDGLPPPEQHLHLHLPPKPENLTDWEAQVRDARHARQMIEAPKKVQNIVPESTNNCTDGNKEITPESTKNGTRACGSTKSCTGASEAGEVEEVDIEDTNHAREEAQTGQNAGQNAAGDRSEAS